MIGVDFKSYLATRDITRGTYYFVTFTPIYIMEVRSFSGRIEKLSRRPCIISLREFKATFSIVVYELEFKYGANYIETFAFKNWLIVATLTWPSVGVKPNTWKSWGFGVLRDSRMFRARQQDPKHLALGCSWCHWKGLEA